MFDESPAIVDTAPSPMVNPEELGLLKLFDDAEESADAAARVVEAAAPVTDLKDELLGFEKFLEIQSTLVNKADGDDKSSLSLYNIDSSDVKFAVVSAYLEDGNVDGARDMLLEMVEQVDGAELERARALLDTL
jgi:FimV-like protein